MGDDLAPTPCLSQSASSIPESACSSHQVPQSSSAHEAAKPIVKQASTVSQASEPQVGKKTTKRGSAATAESESETRETKFVNETQGLLLAGLLNAQSTADADSLAVQASIRKSRSEFLDDLSDSIEEVSLLARFWRSFLQVCYAITLGTLVGLVTVLFHAAASKIEEYHRLGASSAAEQTSWSANACLRGVEFFSSCPGIVFGIFMTLGTTLSAFVAAWICQHIVPECIGGGTIATKICLAVGAPIPLRVGMWRLLLSTLYVGAGNSLGIEAPTLHVCAAIASAFHRFASCVSDCINGCFSRSQPMPPLFENDGLPQAVVLGCAAGLSAAFGSPLAGITYAVEEYVDVRQTGVVTALVLMSCVSATLVRRSFESHTGNGPLNISSQGAQENVESSTLTASAGVDATWMMFATIIGISLGIVSLTVMSGVLQVRFWFQGRPNRCSDIFVSTLGGLAAGLLGCLSYTFTSCDTSWGFGKLENIFATQTMCNMPSDVTSLQEVGVILILVGTKLFAFLLCFALGGSGGALMPSLFIGGLIGKCIGHAFASLDSALPHAGTVLGMAAFFSANMRLPLTGATVVLEYAMVNEAHYDARLVCMIPAAAALGTWVASMGDPLSVHERMMLQDGIDPLSLSGQIELMVKGTDNLMVHGTDDQHGPDENVARHVRSGSMSSCESRASRLSLTGVVNIESGSSMRMLAVAHRRSAIPETRGVFSSRSSNPHDGTRSVLSVPEDLLHASNFRMPLKHARFERIFPRAAASGKKVPSQAAHKPTWNIDIGKMPASCRHASKTSMGSCIMDRGSILSCLPEDGSTHMAHRPMMRSVGRGPSCLPASSAALSSKRGSSVAPSCSGLFGNPRSHLASCSSGSFFSTSSLQSPMSLSSDLSGPAPNPRLLGRGHAKMHAEEEELNKKRVSIGNRFMCFFREPFTRNSICKLDALALGGDDCESHDAHKPAHSRRSSTEVLD